MAGPAGVREIAASTLDAEARRIAALLPTAPRRDILIAGRSPEDPDERAVLAWATVAGAAVVLASPEMRLAAALWARPTLFHGTASEIAALSVAIAERSRRRWHRLRAVLVTGPDDLPAAEREAWSARGVAVCRTVT